ncbi:hypothetical protein Psed_0860 [Pseudonocardia dioxanivorans CB1190]|uniref:Uncharacterized protein n=1 Tax=Pseudonocardia dioxanivorans (strain ATCC 55486 / DSM 44775 / JCM 13855 / CB1190) TaxID=675635 RepID=F4CSE0_PSEUX|nr:hypothetical protein [Pseudonocardia dioxanivorans]AEA23114.1 hypothetical protein Psed_0860 [Pseudonocardia dioxanivorans CB1190]
MAANLQFDVSALDRASATFIKMAAQVERLAAKIDKLDGKKADVELDVDTSKADAKLGKFETDLRTKLAAASKALPELNLDVDTTEASQALARIRNEMAALHDQRLGIDISSADALAELERFRAELEQVSRESADVRVKADTAAAIAQLDTVLAAATAVGASDPEVKVDVDSAPVEQATTALSDMFGMVELVAAAWPPVSAAILAIPGAIALIAAPLAAVVVGMDGIKAAANQLIPAFTQVQQAVGQAFLSGLQPAVAALAKTFPTLQTGLSGTATALSDIANRVASVVSSSAGLNSLQSIFQGVNQIVSSLAPAIATLTQNFLSLATSGLQGLSGLGPMLEQVGQAWAQVIAQMNQTGTVQAAVSGLVQVLGAVLNILPPLVQAGAQLMATLGPPLAAALNGVAAVVGVLAGPLGSLTTTVLAFAAAWKVASAAVALGQAALARGAAAWTAMSGAATAATARTAAAGAATAAAGSAAGTAAGGMSKLGAATAVAALGLAVVSEAARTGAENTDELYNALLDGKNATDQMTASAKLAISGVSTWGETFDDVKAKVDAAKKAMTPLQKAQNELTNAQNAYNDAVNHGNPAAVASAQQRLAAATQAVAKAQQDATLSTSNLGVSFQNASTYFSSSTAATDRAAASAKTLADAYNGLTNPLTTVADKASAFTTAFQMAVDPAVASAEATRALNDSMRQLDGALTPASAKLVQLNGTINTTTEAGSQLQQSVLQTAAAIQNDYGTSVAAAVANGQSLTTASANAAAAFEQQKTKLVDLLVQQGVARPAAQALADTYLKFPKEVSTTFSQPGMVKALADSLGLTSSIIGIPDNKTVIVNSLTDAAQKQLEDLGLTVTRLPNGQIVITARDETSPVIAAAVTYANGQKGTILLDGNPQLVNGKIQESVTLADGSKGTIIIDGDPDPATGQITAVVDLGNGKHTVIKIDPKDNATPVIQNIQGKTVYINVVATGVQSAIAAVQSVAAAASAAAGRAGGGVNGYAGGGITGPIRAARGYVLPGYQPGRDTVPAVLSRGEAVLVPELVRALGARRILAANAEASGGRPATNVGNLAAIMDGTIPDQRTVSGSSLNVQVAAPARAAWSRPLPSGGAVDLGALVGRVDALRADLGVQTQTLDELRADMAGYAAADRATARNTGVLVAEARRSRPGAAATAAGARTQADLGMFG